MLNCRPIPMSKLSSQIARMFCIGFDGLSLPDSARQLLHMGVQHVILFARNISTPAQVFELTARIKNDSAHSVMICIDQEGGRVRRLREGFTQIPSMRALGATGDESLAERVGRTLGRELRAVNIDLDFAPCLDVDTNPANPVIGERSLGADPQLVGRMAIQIIRAMQAEGVAACGKHFPGHGDTHVDSHKALPRVDYDLQRLQTVELIPFKKAINAGIACIMSAHVIVSALDANYPATLSTAALNGIVRQQLNFQGVLFADDFEMKAIADNYGFEESIIRGVLAGCDVIPICHTLALQHQAIETLTKAVERGQVPQSRIDQAGQRIDQLIATYWKKPPPTRTPISPNEELVQEIQSRAESDDPHAIDPTDYKR